MRALIVLIPILAALTAAWGVWWAVTRRRATRAALTRQEHAELVAYRRLVMDIRDLAYRQMAVDPNLATIIVDEIQQTERKLLP